MSVLPPVRTFPVVLAAPSGTGKTTLARALVERFESLVFSISATTRDPREGEVDGVDYHFVPQPDFRAMVERGELAEWAEVHGRLYGTLRRTLEQASQDGLHVVLDIDVQGARQIQESVPEAVLVFVLPPSVEALLDRLTGRGTEPGPEVARRLRSALDELRAVPEFDYVVVNETVDECLTRLEGIIRAERHKVRRYPDLPGRVNGMLERIDTLLREKFSHAKYPDG